MKLSLLYLLITTIAMLAHFGARQTGTQRRGKSDDAGQPHHGYDRHVAAESARQKRPQHLDGFLEEPNFSHGQRHRLRVWAAQA